MLPRQFFLFRKTAAKPLVACKIKRMIRKIAIGVGIILTGVSCQTKTQECIEWYEEKSRNTYEGYTWINLSNFTKIEDVYQFNDTTFNWENTIGYVEIGGKKIPVDIRRVKHREGRCLNLDYGVPVGQDESIGIDSLVKAIKQTQKFLEANVFEKASIHLNVSGEIEREKILENIKTIIQAVCLTTKIESTSQDKVWPIVMHHYIPPPPPPSYPNQKHGEAGE